MDIDAYVAANRERWDRLAALSAQPKLTQAEADELLDLYERTATHLSVVRSSNADPQLVSYLSWLISRARARAATQGRRTTPSNAFVEFFASTFPAALYRQRRWWLSTMALNLGLAVVMGWWFLAHPGFEAAAIDAESVQRLVGHDFENYYSEYAASSFALKVWTNNAWVAAQSIAFGILGLPVLWVLWQNVFNLAFTGSVMIHHGRGALFFGLITPHGLLELTAVFVAAGVGLRLFWAWIEPGPRSRLDAVGAEARTGVGVALGLVVVLFLSGVLEAFVTPSPLPTWARILIGVLAEAAFFAYVFIVGARAARQGVSGDVTGQQSVATAPTAA
ncbi:stage II sporulation protein M [Gephyromycinifex aptenodytis]|uniref:stage II sporulation protein M n=1 Tax=Gephyromycinifex aptenodytis TaxID=2716227 RepID=UPI0014460108|nr:stage II sporulation protein M [Gephyromycinifex aptenodytis]